MKKFLASFFLLIFSIFFLNVKDVYALTELEKQKILDTCGFDDSNKKSSLSEMKKGYGDKCWCLVTETSTVKGVVYSQQVLYFNVGSGACGDKDSFSYDGNKDYSGITSYHRHVLDGVPELEDRWKWTDEDLKKYLLNEGYTRKLASSGCDSGNVDKWLGNNAFYYDTFSGIYINMGTGSKWSMSVSRETSTGWLTGQGVKGKNGTAIVCYNLASSFKGAKMSEDGTLFNQDNMGKVRIKQESMTGSSPYWRKSSCNQCAYDLLIQNSGLISSADLQCNGLVSESDSEWKAYCDAFAGSSAWVGNIDGGTGVLAQKEPHKTLEFYKNISGGINWEALQGAQSVDGTTLDVASTPTHIVKWGDKKLQDMNKDEIGFMLRAFYNNDYFVLMGIKDGNANGPSEARGGHVVLFAGAKKDDIYVNDSAYGQVLSFLDEDKYPSSSTPVKWMIAIKADGGKVSTKTICGAGNVESSYKDEEIAKNLGVSTSVLEKTIDSDAQIASYCKLMETNLEDILDNVNRDDLTGNQLDSLKTWEDTIADASKSGGVLYWIRIIIIWMGILLIIWSVLLYVGFWFDRANNFIDINVVGILTLGKLSASDTDEEYTYGDKDSKSGIKTINSKVLTKICLLGIIAGVLVVSGTLYSIISWLINTILGLISKGV